MFDNFTLAALSDVSAWFLLAMFALGVVRLIYTGKLVPGSTVKMYQDTIAAERASNSELRASNASHQATAIAAVQLLESIQRERSEAQDV